MAVAHPLGGCLTNGKQVYVPIPKNASTSVRQALKGWKSANYANRRCDLPGFVVVRDPISRWFSGVAEYAKRAEQDYDGLLDSVEAGGWPVFDEHTMRQSDFIPSTFDVERVRMDDVTTFLRERFGVEAKTTFSWETKFPDHWKPRESLVPMIRDFYADDFRL